MRLRRSLAIRCFVALLALACASLSLPARAQDRLVFRDGHAQEGLITGMRGNSVTLRFAAGEAAYDLGLLARVEAPPPPAFAAGYAAYQAGEWDKALAALKPLADQFRGLPTDWARQAVAALGDIYIEKKDIARAEAAYADYRRLYPGGAANSLRATVGEARVAFARNSAAQARQQLAPLAAQALQDPARVSPADGAAYGQAFFVLGQLDERDGQYQQALVDYLRTVTLFYEDPAATAGAGKNADSLRAAHKDIVAP